MEAIFLFTMLWLEEPDKYNHTVILNAFKTRAACIERLDRYELEYRRGGQYKVNRYTRENENRTKTLVQGFSAKAKTITFYECVHSFLLDE
jgi:hypothetical protein